MIAPHTRAKLYELFPCTLCEQTRALRAFFCLLVMSISRSSLRVMSLNALLQLVNGHASGAFSDYELSRRLHSLDGKGGFYYV